MVRIRLIIHQQLKWGDLGAILILLGLACVVWDSYKQKNTTEVKNEEDPSQSLLYNDFTEKAVVQINTCQIEYLFVNKQLCDSKTITV